MTVAVVAEDAAQLLEASLLVLAFDDGTLVDADANGELPLLARIDDLLNLFAVGFPVAMLLGFMVIFLNMGSLVENVSEFLVLSISAVSQLLEL